MNAKNKISRSVLKVNCTYTMEDTVRFASLPFISILLHQALPDPSSNRQSKEALQTPQEIPINPKETHTRTAVVGLPDLPTYPSTHLQRTRTKTWPNSPSLLFSSLSFPSLPFPAHNPNHPNQPNPTPKTIMPPPLASRNLLICFDAFGTLFTPKLPIAKQYGNVARSFGLTGSFTDEDVGRAFKIGEADRFLLCRCDGWTVQCSLVVE